VQHAGIYALGLVVAATSIAAACAQADDGDVMAADAGQQVQSDAGGGGSTTAAPANPTGETDGGAGDAGADAGATTSLCAHTGTCPLNLRDIGAVDGDLPGGQLTATGTRSEWLTFRLREGSASIFSADLSALITLTSPAGSSWDMRVYYDHANNQAASFECTNPDGQTSGSGTQKSLPIGWPDTQGIGGNDDSSNVTIEVRHTSGTCNPGGADTWSLLVEGNKQ